jgi:hypothetical protein
MKIIKSPIVTTALTILVVAASPNKKITQSTVTYHFDQVFVIGSVNSDPLGDTLEWAVVSLLLCTGGNTKLCGIIVNSIPGQTKPSKLTIINHVREQYDANGKCLINNEVVEVFVSGIKVAEAVIKLHN